MKTKFLIFALIAVAFSSCKTLTPYTEKLQTEHNWNAEQVKHIQFYLSHDIVLTRELVSGSTDEIHGKVVSKNGHRFDEIKFNKGLRVALDDTTQNGNYLIKCETGDGNILSFGINPHKGGKYVLLASQWRNNQGKIHYNGNEYYTDTESEDTYLMIDLKKAVHEQNTYHSAKGVKVK